MRRSDAPAILVVDDDPAVRGALSTMLEHHGYATRLAGSGAEAVRVFRENSADIVAALVDVCMLGVDGPTTVTLLRGVAPSLPCVLVTGAGGNYTLDQLRECGASAVLGKPFGVAELGKVMAAALTCAATGQVDLSHYSG